MSIKATKFQELLGNPLNTFNFTCIIPALESVQVLVSSTTFPTELLQEFTLYFQGERVKFPSIPSNSGDWNATMPEGEFLKVHQALYNYMRSKYSQQTGQLVYWSITDKFDIEIYPRRLRGDVEGSDKMFGVRMVGCFLKGSSPVGLDNSNATSNWVWDLQFSYDYLEDVRASNVPTDAGAPAPAPTSGYY